MGTIFNLQRLSIHDGSGIRTTVFLKGCPLKCKWCHNPEGMNKHVNLQYNPEKCINCKKCEDVCSKGVHTFVNGIHSVDFDKCTMCKACIESCPSTALEQSGIEITAKKVINSVCRDKAFFGEDGGVTFSGGEPMMQFDFLLELLKEAKKQDLNIALDTSGFSLWKNYEQTLPYVDQYLYDIKGYDDETHIYTTGISNKIVFSNLEKLSATGKKINVRIPLIKEYNTNLDELNKIADFLSGLNIFDLTLMPYHVFGRSKGRLIGMEDTQILTAPSKIEMEEIKKIFTSRNITLSK